jgi:Tfp pilus assembly protein PilF
LLTSNPLYRKESYLFVAVAYSQMKKFDKSNRWLETCLKQHPNYYEAHLQLA